MGKGLINWFIYLIKISILLSKNNLKYTLSLLFVITIIIIFIVDYFIGIQNILF